MTFLLFLAAVVFLGCIGIIILDIWVKAMDRGDEWAFAVLIAGICLGVIFAILYVIWYVHTHSNAADIFMDLTLPEKKIMMQALSLMKVVCEDNPRVIDAISVTSKDELDGYVDTIQRKIMLDNLKGAGH